jgi:O-methyltransferase involved in polyketide biosynthesis
MTDKIRIELGDVQKTLLIPLWGRAKESEKAQPLIVDPFAGALVARLDYDFAGLTGKLPSQFLFNCAVRAHHLDAALRNFLTLHPEGAVVNIGAGLDTTFQRVDNGRLTWYDLDLPDTMALRRQLIPEGPRNSIIAKSVFDPSWFGDVKVRDKGVFLMAGGVFAYLKEKDIKPLFLGLAREFPGSEIMFEIYSRFLVYMRNLFMRRGAPGSEPIPKFHWAVNSGRKIEKWGGGIKVAEEFPFYSRIDLDAVADEEARKQALSINAHQWIKMLRLRLG